MFTNDHHGIIPWEQPAKEETETVRQGIAAHKAKAAEIVRESKRRTLTHATRAKTVA